MDSVLLNLVAAIHGRAMTGKGCFIDVAMSTNIRSALILPVANKSIDNVRDNACL